MTSKALAVNPLFTRILNCFPHEHVKFAFAYGSGTFQQHGNSDVSTNMLDFVFAVDNSVSWHAKNLTLNPKHYAFIRNIGPRYLAAFQEKYGAFVYYNTLVPVQDRLIKYGVISLDSLKNDLLDWDTLYISGRLHKPVAVIKQDASDSQLSMALTTNHQSALHTALLLLPDVFSEEELFLAICGLSYSGDFRMLVGEDRNKIKNIVRPNMEHFRNLYGPYIEKDERVVWNRAEGMLEQSLSTASRYHHLNLLPKTLQLGLVAFRNRDGRHRDIEEVVRSFADDCHCRDVLQDCITGIVRQSSLSQSIKGILTAGVTKTVRYSWRKVVKSAKTLFVK